MNIVYLEPLSRAWTRMKLALFKPFDLNKWMVMGFTAFLATLMDGHNSGGSGSNKSHADWEDIIDGPRYAWEWLLDHTWWFMFIIFIAFVIVFLMILFTWLSSRGKFMFLDNVVQDRGEVVKPWKQFKELGNSLFLWRLCYGFIVFGLFSIFFVIGFIRLAQIYDETGFSQFPIMFVLQVVLLFILMLIFFGYISMFLDHFVVPIMYKNNNRVLSAWNKFIPLLTQHFLNFILYGLFIFVLTIAIIILIVFFGLFTCCLGFLLLIIPYIGSVVTLPITYTIRALSLEFLAQFGDEYVIFEKMKQVQE
ncbi:hypothetical protein JXQ31_08450 [candidate division KSB1 bacterium]|nr:hypothetical protein [candidate division KSB1 bacterium]